MNEFLRELEPARSAKEHRSTRMLFRPCSNGREVAKVYTSKEHFPIGSQSKCHIHTEISWPSSTFQRWFLQPLPLWITLRWLIFLHNILFNVQGNHEYKYIVDGNEKLNGNAKIDEVSQNNVIQVKKSDFEVFEALAMDLASNTKSNENNSSNNGSPRGKDLV